MQQSEASAVRSWAAGVAARVCSFGNKNEVVKWQARAEDKCWARIGRWERRAREMQGRNEGKRKGKEGRGGKGKSEQKRRATVMMRVREMRCSMQAQTWERPRKLAKEERAGWFS